MTSRPPLALLGFVALAACGGGGGAGGQAGGSGGGGGQAGTYESLDQAFGARASRIAGAGLTAPSDLPAGGSAIYHGEATLSSSSTGDLRGVATLEADFGGGEVAGTLGGFVAEGDAAWSGTLSLAPGAIHAAQANGEPSQYANDLSGTLTSPAGQAYVTSGRLDGDFWGPGGTYVNGTIQDGLVCVEGLCVPLLGQYNAE